MKARDIVPGWPRGSSTRAWSQWEYEPFRWLWEPPSNEARAEFELNADYHRAQEVMQNSFLNERSYVRRFYLFPL